jgi:hypothetical protein
MPLEDSYRVDSVLVRNHTRDGRVKIRAGRMEIRQCPSRLGYVWDTSKRTGTTLEGGGELNCDDWEP